VTGYRVFVFDQTYYMLSAFKHIILGFCSHDFFMQHFNMNVHMVYTALIRGLYLISFGKFELFIFLAWFFFLFGFIHALFMLNKALGGQYYHFAGLLVIISFTSNYALADGRSYVYTLIPGFIAVTLSLYSTAFLLAKQYNKAFFFLGLSALVHIQYSVMFGFGLIYLIIRHKEINIKIFGSCLFLFFCFALPNILYTKLNFTGATSFYMNIVAPEYYQPTAFPMTKWVNTLIPTFLAIFFLFQKTNKKDVLLWLCSFIFVMLLALILFLCGIELLMQFNFFRMSFLVLVISYIIICHELFQNNISLPKRLLIILLSLSGNILYFSIKAYIISAFFLLLGIIFCNKTQKKPFITTIMTIVILFFGSGSKHSSIFPDIKYLHIHYENEMMTWLKNNTPCDTTIMCHPEIKGIRLNAHRAIIVNYFITPLGEEGFFEWKTRLEATCGLDSLKTLGLRGRQLELALYESYLRNTPEQVKEIMHNYHADYFITYLNHENLDAFTNDPDFEKQYSNERLNTIIFKLLN
jgi:hypothetical protein